MPIAIPDLDPRDEDEVVASVIDSLPAELSDRNAATFEVKLIEGIGAFYGLILGLLGQVLYKLQLDMLNLLGIEQEAATKASVTLRFTATAAGATVPAGTVVKTGPAIDDVSFVTDSALVVAPSSTGDVQATAVLAGIAGNVAAGLLTELDEPIAGVDSVTNPTSASGGQDLESLDDMIDRAALENRQQDRIVTAEDFELEATNVAGVLRAVHTNSGAGSVQNVHLLIDDYNERFAGDEANATDQAIRDEVESSITAKIQPGVIVTALQHVPRLFVITKIDAELRPNYNEVSAAALAQSALAAYLDAGAWTYGAKVYRNELIVIADGSGGIERVDEIYVDYSDDFGATWTYGGATPSTDTPMPHSIQSASDGVEGQSHSLAHEGFTAWGSDLTIVAV